MNPAQRQLVWSGAIVAAMLGVAAARELGKPQNCRDDIVRWVDDGGRTTIAKIQNCD